MQKLQAHLADCSSCHTLMDEWIKTEAMIKTMPSSEPSAALAEHVMKHIPSSMPYRRRWVERARRRPALTAAVIFLLIMMVSVFAMNQPHDELVVKGANLDQIEIQGNRVVVPEGKIVQGNLIVENGIVEVQGQVDGNVTIIDGKFQLASTASISGKVTNINQWIDRFWYTIYEWFSS